MYLEKKKFSFRALPRIFLCSLIIDSLFIITKTSSICYHTNKIYKHILFLQFQNLQERVYDNKPKNLKNHCHQNQKFQKKAGERHTERSITQNTDSPEPNTLQEQTKKGTHIYLIRFNACRYQITFPPHYHGPRIKKAQEGGTNNDDR